MTEVETFYARYKVAIYIVLLAASSYFFRGDLFYGLHVRAFFWLVVGVASAFQLWNLRTPYTLAGLNTTQL